MQPNMSTIRIGAAAITTINIGDFYAPFWDEWLQLSAEDWARLAPGRAIGPARMPIQCFYVALPDTTLLIDAGIYPVEQGHPYSIPGYQPPPGLLACLAEIGVRPDSIGHVVITHTHFDHYNGVAFAVQGRDTPCFPRARHYVGRADWEQIQHELGDPESVAHHTLAVVQQAGLLELAADSCDPAPGVRIIAAPGESPGHQIVRIETGERIVYLLGDLYHHTVEVAHPTWMPQTSDAAANYRSRMTFVEAALREHALLFATHIPSIGRLARDTAGVHWEAVELLGDPLLYPLSVE